jgi:hypothetical protein
VLCVDEKSQVQALNRTQPILPLAPSVPTRQSHDYERHGVTLLFAAMDMASGVTISTGYRRHRHPEFLRERPVKCGISSRRICGQSAAVPGEDGIWFGDTGDILKRSPPEPLTDLSEGASRGPDRRMRVGS